MSIATEIWVPPFTGTPPKVVLFGNLHAHYKLSDDIKNAGDNMLPIKAFEYAHANGLDFLAITDHHQGTDAPGRLSLTQTEYKEKLYDVALDYNSKNKMKFVAVPGIEWGNMATGNHVNMLGAKAVPPDDIKNKDYDKLFEWAKQNCEFIQFNHPNSWSRERKRNKDVGNYLDNVRLPQVTVSAWS